MILILYFIIVWYILKKLLHKLFLYHNKKCPIRYNRLFISIYRIVIRTFLFSSYHPLPLYFIGNNIRNHLQFFPSKMTSNRIVFLTDNSNHGSSFGSTPVSLLCLLIHLSICRALTPPTVDQSWIVYGLLMAGECIAQIISLRSKWSRSFIIADLSYRAWLVLRLEIRINNFNRQSFFFSIYARIDIMTLCISAV